MRIFKHIVASLLVAILLALIMQNLELVKLRFVVWKIALPLAVPAILAYMLGAFTGRYLFRFMNAERKDLEREHRVRKRVKRQAEIHDRGAAL